MNLAPTSVLSGHGQQSKLLNDAKYYAQSFADDLATLIIGMCFNTVSELMQSALKLVENWCRAQKQNANPSKTKLMLFTNKRLIVGFKPPTFFGVRIYLSDIVKYEGYSLLHMLGINGYKWV